MRSYAEALKLLYKCTTLVFATPQDVHCFHTLVPPEGLQDIRSIILAYGRVDKSFALFIPGFRSYIIDPIENWISAFDSFRSMTPLQELQVWLYHRNWRGIGHPARPRTSGEDDIGVLDSRHAKLFDLLDGLNVRRVVVDMEWYSDDISKWEERSFMVNVRTANEIQNAMHALTPPVYDNSDIYE